MRVEPRPWVKGLTPYQPGSHRAAPEGMLASNESPYGPSPRVRDAVADAVRDLHRYPDPSAARLRAALARRHGVDPEQVLIGNGSDELIYLLAWAFAAGGGTVLCADPAYALDVLSAVVAGADVRRVPLVRWRHDLEAMARVEADLAYLVNPHNPTGTVSDGASVERFVATARARVVVVDEAYIDFAQVPSAMPLAAAGKALVLRTFSKVFGLAGARVGYLVGDPEVLDVLRSIRAPFSVGALAQAAAVAALADTEHYEAARRRTIVNRARLTDLLRERGYAPVASQANFVLVPDVAEGALVERLARDGIAVRPGSVLGVPGSVRISVPDDVGLARLAAALPPAS